VFETRFKSEKISGAYAPGWKNALTFCLAGSNNFDVGYFAVSPIIAEQVMGPLTSFMP
jgi:hypothetical protein